MSGFREALTAICDRYDRIAEQLSIRSGAKATYDIPGSEIRSLLAAHPAEPAPVASRERIAEVLREAGDIHPASILPGWFGHAANALLAAGVFRDEAQVKAEARKELGTEVERLLLEYRQGFDSSGPIANALWHAGDIVREKAGLW